MSKQTSYSLIFFGLLALLIFKIYDTNLSSITYVSLISIACSGAIVGGLFVELMRARRETKNAGAAK